LLSVNAKEIEIYHSALISSPLSDLREAFIQPSDPATEELAFTPKRTVEIPDATPCLLALARNDTRLVIGLTNGAIAVFDTNALFTAGFDGVFPLHTFPCNSPVAPKLILPNPAHMPFVAVLRGPDASLNSPIVEVLNVETMQSVSGWRSAGTPETTPTARVYTFSNICRHV